ncbi:MAG: folylpolyglutamate synthase/dihydrofolate synthase family protein [Thermodesulfobacteriota bacterium]|nr:folylpolyglutamate synthase/dihydrofolate synthase family protein [Thermodesulfobacteriota bacterium]
MKQISYNECLDEMYALGRFGIKLELSTIKDILKRLNLSEPKFKSIHIAGTNGKGSIASYTASLLREAGFKTALYTSPHLVKFNERFSINGIDVSNDDIVESYLAVQKADTGERKATFFEIATAMGFYLFNREKVQWAVLETGMGGRLDATNVVKPELCIISNLSIEHTDYLGETIQEIAGEKCGIIKKNTPVITGVKQEEALAVLKKIAKKKSAPLYLYKKDFNTEKNSKEQSFNYNGINNRWTKIKTSLPGNHQIENAGLALAALELLFANDFKKNHHGFNLTEKGIRKSIQTTTWPGRLEHIMVNPMVILDGAHNFEAAKNLGTYLSQELSEKKITLVIGILDDKPYESMLKSLVPHVNKIIITKAKIDRSLEPEILKQAVEKLSNQETIIIKDAAEAVEYAVKGSSGSDVICVAGSLYVAGEARAKIIKDLI